MLIDSHAHLDAPQFDADREEVIRRASDAGLEMVLTIGTGDREGRSVEAAVRLADRHSLVYTGIGVHPHDAKEADDACLGRLENLATHPKVVLWGEIGLDYYYDHSPRDVQREVFRLQLVMAARLDLPVAVHCRDAWEDTMAILREAKGGAPLRGVMHSFTGSGEQALECSRMGFMISFSGMVTFKNARPLRDTVRSLPLQSILVETDCPYLAPVPYRGKRNEPAFVSEVAREVARCRGMEQEFVAAATSDNARRLLQVARPQAPLTGKGKRY